MNWPHLKSGLSLQGYLAANAIKLGSLYLKPKTNIETLLSSYVGPLTVEHGQYLGLIGSFLRVDLSGEKFAICTAHQFSSELISDLAASNFESARFTNLNSGTVLKNLPVDAVMRVNGFTDEEVSDILIFHVKTDVREHLPAAAGSYFPIRGFDTRNREFSWAIGFPFQLNSIEQEPLIAKFIIQMIECQRDTTFHSHAVHLKRYSFDGDPDINLNGYSGGAVFSLASANKEFEFVLDGVIIRGGGGFIYVIDGNFLVNGLRKYDPQIRGN